MTTAARSMAHIVQNVKRTSAQSVCMGQCWKMDSALCAVRQGGATTRTRCAGVNQLMKTVRHLIQNHAHVRSVPLAMGLVMMDCVHHVAVMNVVRMERNVLQSQVIASPAVLMETVLGVMMDMVFLRMVNVTHVEHAAIKVHAEIHLRHASALTKKHACVNNALLDWYPLKMEEAVSSVDLKVNAATRDLSAGHKETLEKHATTLMQMHASVKGAMMGHI